MDERTVEILNRFHTAWIQTETLFDDLITNHEGFEHLIPIREFIADLEQSGGKKLYRLGTSMHTLIISRSVDHGLRLDQKLIKIEAVGVNDFEITMRDGKKIYRQYRVKDLKDIRVSSLLRTLRSILVD
jgi:hypothetical protein